MAGPEVPTWSVLLLFSSVIAHERMVSSRMNISHALAKTTGASALIICRAARTFVCWILNSNYP
jgi:hypothetical protein